MAEREFQFKGSDCLEKLERLGALRTLVILMDGRIHVSKIIKRGSDDPGIATQNAMKTTRDNLKDLGLTREYEAEVPLTATRRTYIELTEKGKVIAELVKTLGEEIGC